MGSYIFLAIFSFIISIGIHKIFLATGIQIPKENTKKNKKEQIRWTAQTKPLIGGICLFTAFWATFIGYRIFVSEATIFDNEFIPLFITSSFAFGLGLFDDLYRIRPIYKLIGQFICASLFVYFQIQIYNFNQLPLLNTFLTFIWIVGIMNSTNMIDNMDGIVGSLVTGVLIISIVIALSQSNYLIENHVYLFILLGACVGFLFYNFHPSSLYMGDSGSQFIGLLLAYIGIKIYWNMEISTFLPYSTHWLLPLLIFIVPITDTLFVVIARLKQGKSPAIGGKDHTTHHLYYAGYSTKGIAIYSFLFTLIPGSILLLFIFNPSIWWTFIMVGYLILFWSVMIFVYLKGSKVKKEKSLMKNNNTPTIEVKKEKFIYHT